MRGEGAERDVRIERLVGPQVNAKVIHVGGGKEVSRGREGETGGR